MKGTDIGGLPCNGKQMGGCALAVVAPALGPSGPSLKANFELHPDVIARPASIIIPRKLPMSVLLQPTASQSPILLPSSLDPSPLSVCRYLQP